MKLTKKAAALLLAAALAVSVCATPVFAAENMGSQVVNGSHALGVGVGDTKVIYKVTESYTWSIPATIDFGENAGANNTPTVNATLGKNDTGVKADADNQWKGSAPKVVVSKNVIGVHKNLKITVSTDYLDTDIDPNGKFYVKEAGTTEKLYFTITRTDKAGTHDTTLDKRDNMVLNVPAGTDTADQELVFELATAKGTNVSEKAGTYEGHVIFNSQIVD